MTISIQDDSCHKRFTIIIDLVSIGISIDAICRSCERDLKTTIYRCSVILSSLDKSGPAILNRLIYDIVTVKVTEGRIASYCAKVRFYISLATICLINTENDALTCIAVRKVIS